MFWSGLINLDIYYHPGGLSVRRGVVHKTVRSVCDFKEETYCLVSIDEEKLRIFGKGMETDFIYLYTNN